MARHSTARHGTARHSTGHAHDGAVDSHGDVDDSPHLLRLPHAVLDRQDVADHLEGVYHSAKEQRCAARRGVWRQRALLQQGEFELITGGREPGGGKRGRDDVNERDPDAGEDAAVRDE